MRVRLQTLAISGLERAQFFRLTLAGIDRESLVDKEIPDLLAALARIERLVLRIAHTAKLRVGLGRLGPVAIADDLKHAFALIDLLAQHRAQVAGFRTEDVLPDWLVAEESQRVGGKLAATPQLAADRGNENQR